MAEAALTADQALRKQRMESLARSSRQELEPFWKEHGQDLPYSYLREPEIGLVMVRGRAGGTGQRFNLGEMTVTRCSVRLSDGTVGHGYVKGRDKRHAELAALFDARFVQDDTTADFLDILNNRRKAERDNQSAKAAATKVDFYTMVRGED